jgi:hypothetical protein
MKHIISTIIATISLIIGYNIYPVVNSTKSIEKTNPITESAFEKNSDSECNNTNKTSSFVIEAKSINEQTNSPQDAITESEDIINVSNSNRELEIETTNNQFVAMDNIGKQELEDWSSNHREHLLNIIDAKVPDGLKKKYIDIMSKENDFLDAPTIKQDPVIDSDWAFMMEQQLREIIEEDESSDNFELYSLTCKQLTCEIVGGETVANTWTAIFTNLMGNQELAVQLDHQYVQGSSISKDGINYVYFQLKFKSNTI